MPRNNRVERLRASQEEIESISARMQPESIMRRTAGLFAVLSDPTRLKIILALSAHELCVGDLAFIVGASDSAVSHQLRILRNMDLVDHRREGKLTLYSLSDEHLKTILEQSLAHVSE